MYGSWVRIPAGSLENNQFLSKTLRINTLGFFFKNLAVYVKVDDFKDKVKEINWENLEIEENEPNGNSRSFKVKLPKELSNPLYFNISLNLVSP